MAAGREYRGCVFPGTSSLLPVEEVVRMSDTVMEAEVLPAIDREAAVRAILGHLTEAVELAMQIGRDDWVGRLEKLHRMVSGGGRSRGTRGGSSVQLAPVGPPVDLLQWVDECISSLTSFRADYMAAHADAPDAFPRERPAEEWFEEWGSSRMRLQTSASEEDPEDGEE